MDYICWLRLLVGGIWASHWAKSLGCFGGVIAIMMAIVTIVLIIVLLLLIIMIIAIIL